MRRNNGTLNGQLARVISETGHTDQIVITDAGLPIPPAVERVDLAIKPGLPAFFDVLDAVFDELQIEGAVMSEEIRSASPEMLHEIEEHRLSHLDADLGGARCGGLDQPQPYAVTQLQERSLGSVAGLRDSTQRPSRGRREMRVRHLRAARCGPPVTGDLDRPVGPDVNDDHLLVAAGAMDPHPHGLAEQVGWDRVLGAVVGDHRHLGRHGPAHSERDGVRVGRDRVQPPLFGGEHLGWDAAGDPVDPGVHVRTAGSPGLHFRAVDATRA